MERDGRPRTLSFLEGIRPDLIYVAGGKFSPRENHQQIGDRDEKTNRAGSAPLLDAALRTGVKRLMHVERARTYHQATSVGLLAKDNAAERVVKCAAQNHPNDHDAALLRRALVASFDKGPPLDYRRVLTCEPYGPSWSMSGAWLSAYAGTADHLIARMLRRLSAAKSSGVQSATIALDPSSSFDLMFVDDIADAAVFLMELPRTVFGARQSAGSHHIHLATGIDINACDLADAVAAAVGYRGHVAIEPVRSLGQGSHHGAERSSDLEWMPLVSLATGLELTAMAFHISQIAKSGTRKHGIDPCSK